MTQYSKSYQPLGTPPVLQMTNDTMVILSATTLEHLQHKFEALMEISTKLLSTIAVKLNIHKTEILFLPGSLPCTTYPTFTYKCYILPSQHSIKYLGVMIDNKFTFTPHFEYLYEKTKKIIKQLQIIFQNELGLSLIHISEPTRPY